jgi:hypothetical protein
MEDWFGCLPLSDRLDNPLSGVYKEVGDGWYVCRLCCRDDDRERLSKYEVQRHADEPLHQKRAQKLLKERDAVLDRAHEALRLYGDAKRFPSLEAAICVPAHLLRRSHLACRRRAAPQRLGGVGAAGAAGPRAVEGVVRAAPARKRCDAPGVSGRSG